MVRVQPLIPHSRSLGRNSQRESGDDIRLANASVRRQPDGSFVVSAGAAGGGSSGSSSSTVGTHAPPTRSRRASALVGDSIAHAGDVVVRAELKVRAHIMRSCVATQHTPASRSFVPRVLFGGLARDPT